MPAISKGGRRMHSSSLDPAEGLSLYAPSTHFFVNCCCSVGFPMRARQGTQNPRLSPPIRRPYLTALVSRRGGSRRKTSSSGHLLGASTPFRNSALSSSHRRDLSRDHLTSECDLR